MPRFTERAMLKVYVERADLMKLTERARVDGRDVSEYVRGLLLEHLNGTGDGENLRGAGGDGVDLGRAGVLARPANDFIGATVPPTSLPTIPDSTPAGGTLEHTLDAVAPEAQKRGKVSFTVPSKNKSKNWCRHGIMKGGRCVRCSGGIAR